MFGENTGLILCTNGTREVLINGELFHIEKDILCISSPIIVIYELSRSKDYTESTILDNAEVFYQIIKNMFDIIVNFRLHNTPCMKLDEEYIDIFLKRKNLIETKKEYLKKVSNADEQIILKQIIHLNEQATMLEFFHLFYNQKTLSPISVGKNKAIAFKFIYSLNLNYKTQRNVGFYANEVKLSLSHFTRIIKNETNKTPSEWIADITVINAKLLLKKSGMNIKEIAAELHFPEQFTFRKFFKSRVGLSPKEYRLQHKENQ